MHRKYLDPLLQQFPIPKTSNFLTCRRYWFNSFSGVALLTILDIFPFLLDSYVPIELHLIAAALPHFAPVAKIHLKR